jgi:hypothetical protein
MPESEEDKAGIWRQRIQDAIKLATEGNWKKAVEANESIIKVFPTDVDAYNRLGRAHMELGDYKKAKDSYGKALELSPINTIARKNLERLALLKGAKITNGKRSKAKPSDFIAEVGKAGVVNLQDVAPKSILVKMTPGEKVFLDVRNQDTIVKNEGGEYLGVIEPGHGLRLAKLLKGGNKYIAAVVSLDNDRVKVIIRETFQQPSQHGKLSFPIKVAEVYPAHVKDSLLRHSAGEEEGLEEVEAGESEEGETVPDGFSIYEGYTSPDEIHVDGRLRDEE